MWNYITEKWMWKYSRFHKNENCAETNKGEHSFQFERRKLISFNICEIFSVFSKMISNFII